MARGENRALEAAQAAVSSPLLEETSIHGARGVLINITGGDDLTLHEVAEAARAISDAVDPDANIISGLVLDPTMDGEVKVTVIATGADGSKANVRVNTTFADSRFDESPQPVWSQPREVEVAAAKAEPAVSESSTFTEPTQPTEPSPELEPDPDPDQMEMQEKVPFYKKVLAHSHEKDSGGFGPNWSNVDDYDIPTVLRKSMD